jgi:hypothetical protein
VGVITTFDISFASIVFFSLQYQWTIHTNTAVKPVFYTNTIHICLLMNMFWIVRFQVLTAASMKFRIVFWDVLPCKIIVDRRFRGTCCLRHQGWSLMDPCRIIPDDGNVGRQLFYTAVHPRRQFWTSCSEFTISSPMTYNLKNWK